VIIKHKLCLSDVETVQQIQENPYLQYFVGLAGYQQTAAFAPSLFVEIRKRMGATVFDGFNQAIIDAHEGKKTSKQPETTAQSTPDCANLLENRRNRSMKHPVRRRLTPQKPTHQGRLIVDATVVEQAIRYPTDLSLLNEAREFSELIIDKLCVHLQVAKKPRTYRQSARKAYLAIAKQKRLNRKTLRRGLKQQLQYLRRNLGHIGQLLQEIPEGEQLPLPAGYTIDTG